ncbi:hypothetical protein PIB30_014114 [Stylosanthes scabra]|nr:hypothetical protein [Stylosanthes scabra]
MLQVLLEEVGRTKESNCAIILNTFDALEHDALQAISSILAPQIYTIGPLNLLSKYIIHDKDYMDTMGSNLWKEERECLKWLDTKDPNSVIYVNFGSITVMTSEQLVEFAWGLANSNHPFLWVIRPDLVAGDKAVLNQEFVTEIANRGMLSGWCPQEEVLGHPAIGGFLTHSGWNSTLESLSSGVPMICWPFFSDQPTNCRLCCKEWGVGLEIGGVVVRERVEELVRELMEGEKKGKELTKKALEWKKLAQDATAPDQNGSSFMNFDKLVRHLLGGDN